MPALDAHLRRGGAFNQHVHLAKQAGIGRTEVLPARIDPAPSFGKIVEIRHRLSFAQQDRAVRSVNLVFRI